MNGITDKEFNNIREYAKKSFGINLSNEKKTLVFSRLNSVIKKLGLNNFDEYYNYLKNDKTGEAVKVFMDRLTTNHTYFMRETDHFDYFYQTVLPDIEKKYQDKKDIRVWCGGCSSGEEAYTLQILLSEYFENKPGWNIDLLATDISTSVLVKASKGVYSKESLEAMDKKWIKKYLREYDSENMVFKDDIKRRIIFRRFNFMDDKFSFKQKLHVIFCRNVMIYFDNQTREKVVSKFYDCTIDEGYLFIGHSESLSNTSSNYKYIMPAVYKKHKTLGTRR